MMTPLDCIRGCIQNRDFSIDLTMGWLHRAPATPRLLVWLIAALTCAQSGLSQMQERKTARPEFEAASIHPSPRFGSGAVRLGRTVTPGGLTMLGVTPKDLIMWAFGLKAYQVLGPVWISEEWYDINAKPAGPTSEDGIKAMLQYLLVQRFRLASHVETRTLPVYLLTVAKNGPKIKAIQSEDTARYFPRRRGVYAMHVTIRKFAELLSGKVDRPVTDMTGLGGFYDIDLDWAQDAATAANAGPAIPAADLDPSIFTAIQEQLGLKLAPTKGPLEMFVIGRIERPSEN
jgi:uncharacterized protein (TIGR03435 family)